MGANEKTVSHGFWDPWAEPGYTLVQTPLAGGRRWRLKQPYCIRVPPWFQEKWDVTDRIYIPERFDHDDRSAPLAVVLKRGSWITPVAVGHDALYNARRVLLQLRERELEAWVTHYERLVEKWTRRASDAFYFEHSKAVVQANNLGYWPPRDSRWGHFISRWGSWGGLRVGGWFAWQSA